MRLRLNPSLDIEAYARAYADNKFIQIPNLFDDETADTLEAVLGSLEWRLICQDETRTNVLLTSAQLKSMTADERRKLETGVLVRAAENFGYMYLTYPMIEAAVSGWDRGHPIHALTQFLNSPSFLAFARQLVGERRITKVDAQASNYQPGHFLTVHRDHGEKSERRAAYTIGFSRGWRPDWGGLLLFLDESLDVQRGFLPRFNTLTVFDGLMTHSVSAVSAFAPRPRLSVVGWFRDDPPASTSGNQNR